MRGGEPRENVGKNEPAITSIVMLPSLSGRLAPRAPHQRSADEGLVTITNIAPRHLARALLSH